MPATVSCRPDGDGREWLLIGASPEPFHASSTTYAAHRHTHYSTAVFPRVAPPSSSRPSFFSISRNIRR